MVACVTVALLGSCLSDACAQVKTWTSQAGTEVNAEYVGLENGIVTFKSESGEMLQIGLGALSENSQKIIEAIEAQKEKDKAARLGPIERLTTVVPDSYITGKNEVIGRYEHKLFDVMFSMPEACAYIFMKEDGEYLTEPIQVRLHVGYYDTQKKRWPQRKIVEILEKPRYSRGEVLFKLKFEDDVYGEVLFRAEENQVSMSYKVKDPPGITYASNHQLTASMAPLFKEEPKSKLNYNARFKEGMTWEQINTTVSEYEVIVHGRDGERIAYPYQKGIERMKSPAGEAEIKPGALGQRNVTVSVSEKGGHLQPYIYRGYAPVTGYRLSYIKHDPNTSATARDKIMTIEIE